MRKNMAKGMAALLSAALLVTTVGVTPGTTASAASKELSGAVKKATIYKGGPAAKKTVTLKVKKNGKNVTKKCTWTSSKKAVATVNKSGKVTAKKAGNTVISAKYAGKTYKCNVKVKKYRYATALSNLPKSVVELKKVGDTKELRVKYADSKPTTKGVRYASSDESVATVTKSGTITARGEGTATITVTTKKDVARKTITETVEVKVGGEETQPTTAPTATAEATPTATPAQEVTTNETPAASIEGKVLNAIKGYDNTVLAGQSAHIQYVVKDKDGKPIAGEKVTFVKETSKAPAGGRNDEYNLNGDKTVLVETTDKNGLVDFLLAPRTSMKNTETGAVASYKVSAQCTTAAEEGKEAVKAEALNVRVGAIRYKGVNSLTAKGNLAPGINSKKGATGASSDLSVIEQTNNMSEEIVEFAKTQQVSADGVNHALTFGAGVQISIPASDGEITKTTKFVQEIGEKTGEYDVYDGKNINVQIKKDGNFNRVEYATLNLDKIDVSRYTKMEVTLKKAGVKDNVIATYGSDESGKTETSRTVQIQKDYLKAYDFINVSVKSEGQVNSEMCGGVDVKDLTYVYNTKDEALSAKNEDLSTVDIKWEAVSPYFTVEKELNHTDAKALFDAATDGYPAISIADGETASYRMPEFPYVGNAIVTIYDRSGSPVRYYSVATKNEASVSVATGYKYLNRNVLVPGTDYLITKQETEALKEGEYTLTTDGNKVTIDSKKSGYVFLKGTLDSKDESLNLDASNDALYTYVMWNPIPNAAGGAASNKAFIAVKGQKVTVNAQLYDRNNNPATEPNVDVTFDLNGTKIVKGTNDKNSFGIGENGTTPVNVTSLDAKTDSKGMAKITLFSDQIADLVNVTASSANSNYKVKVNVGGEDIDKADIYWVTLGLYYKPSPSQAATDTLNVLPGVKQDNNVNVQGSDYGINEKWKVGVKVSCKGLFANGTLKGKQGGTTRDIKVVTKQGTKFNGSASDGTVTPDAKVNGQVLVTSNRSGAGTIVFDLNGATVPADATYSIGGTNYKSVGEGAINVKERMTLGYSFESSKINLIGFTPLGQVFTQEKIGNAPNDAKKKVYVQVTDVAGTGLEGKLVRFTLHGASDGKNLTSGGTTLATISAIGTATTDMWVNKANPTDKYIDVLTNGSGVAGVYLDAFAPGMAMVDAELIDTKTGTVDKNVANAAMNYEFKESTKLFTYDLSRTKFTTNTITLAFNEDVSKAPNFLFYMVYNDGKSATSPDVSFSPDKIASVKVDGSIVTITMKEAVFTGINDNSTLWVKVDGAKPAVPVKLSASPAAARVSGGVDYYLTSINGKTLVENMVKITGGTSATTAGNSPALKTYSDSLKAALSDAKAGMDKYDDPGYTTFTGNVQTARTNYNTLKGAEKAYADLDSLTELEAKVITEDIKKVMAGVKTNTKNLNDVKIVADNVSAVYNGTDEGKEKVLAGIGKTELESMYKYIAEQSLVAEVKDSIANVNLNAIAEVVGIGGMKYLKEVGKMTESKDAASGTTDPSCVTYSYTEGAAGALGTHALTIDLTKSNTTDRVQHLSFNVTMVDDLVKGTQAAKSYTVKFKVTPKSGTTAAILALE